MHDSQPSAALSDRQYQQVLDSFGAGKISRVYHLPGVTLAKRSATVLLARTIIETSKGLFLLAHASDDTLYPAWWCEDSAAFADLLMRAVGLVQAQALTTLQSDAFTVHRFDHRFSLFQL